MITLDHVSASSSLPESRPPLRDISLEIDAGAIYGIYGPGGSGKSALLRLIGLRERPELGAVVVGGVNTAPMGVVALRKLRRNIVAVDAQVRMCADRTVAGNIAMPLERLGIGRRRQREIVEDLLDLTVLGATATALPTRVSRGQRRRAAIARALTVDPQVLTVDEPTAGLSAEEAGCVLATLDRVRAELGVTVVIATGNWGDVGKLCDSVAVLDAGRLLESGAVLNLVADQSSRTAQQLLPSITAEVGSHDFDKVAEVLLIGHATVGRLIPEACEQLDVDIATIAARTTRVAETPVARVRIGLRGERSDAALWWIGEHGGRVTSVYDSAPVLVVGKLAGRRRRSLLAVNTPPLAKSA